MMNNTFNTSRFGRLFKKYTVEHGRTHLMSIAVLTGILLLAMGFTSLNGRLSKDDQYIVFIATLLIGGSIFTSMVFADLGDNRKAIPQLTLPVSHLEKYMVVWLYTLLIFLIIFLGAFYLTAGIIVAITPGTFYDPVDTVIEVFKANEPPLVTLIIYVALHAFVFCGAIFFKKLHFVKTAFAFFIGLILLVFANNIMLYTMINNRSINTFLPFSEIRFRDDATNNFASINVPYGTAISGGVVVLAIVLLLWATAFYRLKEKEV